MSRNETVSAPRKAKLAGVMDGFEQKKKKAELSKKQSKIRAERAQKKASQKTLGLPFTGGEKADGR